MADNEIDPAALAYADQQFSRINHDLDGMIQAVAAQLIPGEDLAAVWNSEACGAIEAMGNPKSGPAHHVAGLLAASVLRLAQMEQIGGQAECNIDPSALLAEADQKFQSITETIDTGLADVRRGLAKTDNETILWNDEAFAFSQTMKLRAIPEHQFTAGLVIGLLIRLAKAEQEKP